MGVIYRVVVTAEQDGDYETLFELAGGPQLIGRLAPSAVVEAVAQRTEAVRADVPSSLAERVMDAAAAAGAPVVPSWHPFGGEQPTKQRKRRTKAEIAADNEAQAAGFRDAAHRAEAETQQAGQPAVDEPSSAQVELAATREEGPPAAPHNPFATN